MITEPHRSIPLPFIRLALVTGMLISGANAQVNVAVLHSFAGSPTDGARPFARLTQGPDGTLYGTTAFGGASNLGTIFRIAPDGSNYAVLHSFTASSTDGAFPFTGLVQGPDGTLYGTTTRGPTNPGSVFRVAPDGSNFTLLHIFKYDGTDGYYPSDLILASDGVLYGTTNFGGSRDSGTFFRIATDGTGYTILRNFTDDRPTQLIQGLDGTLYGTGDGGTAKDGMIFQMTIDGRGLVVLYSFTLGDDGGGPNGVIQATDGMLYGTTVAGDIFNQGTLFRIAPDGTGYNILHNFPDQETDGTNPWAGLIQAQDGALYGTTTYGGAFGSGVIFQVAPDGNDYTVVHAFTGGETDGANPQASLTQGPDGTLYGTTTHGGSSDLGVVFQLTPGVRTRH